MRLLHVLLALATLLHLPAAAKVFLTQEEALKLAFPPGARVERKSWFLTDAEKERVRKLSGSAPSGLAVSYTATRDGAVLGAAYFDTHVVRTQQETILVVVDPKGGIARIEVLSFLEPEEYLPRATWYLQLQGRPLNDDLSAKRGVRPVTGATLTVKATTEAARRVLAVHQVLTERSANR